MYQNSIFIRRDLLNNKVLCINLTSKKYIWKNLKHLNLYFDLFYENNLYTNILLFLNYKLFFKIIKFHIEYSN